MRKTDGLLLENDGTRPRGGRVAHSFVKNAALVFSSIFIGAIVCELVLRWVLPTPITWSYPQESYEYDHEIGHKLRPNQRSFTHDQLVTTNALGLRDAEHSPVPAAGVTRILAIGDSQTFGNGLPLSETWPKQLEKMLNVNAKTWQVINGGLPATDTWQHKIMFDRLSQAYSPQIAVLAVYVNDITRKYSVNKQHINSMSNSSEKRLTYLLKQSALVLALRQAYTSLGQGIEPDAKALREKSVLNGSHHPAVEAGWNEVERSMASMKKLAEERGIRLLLVVLPRKDQVDGTEPGQAYNTRVRVIAEKLGVPVIDVLSDLKRAHQEEGTNLFIPWDGHNSAAANKVIAQRLAHFFLPAPLGNGK